MRKQSPTGTRPTRVLLAALGGTLITIQLGGAGLGMVAQASAWGSPDRWVAATVTCLGAVAGVVLSAGCWLLTASALAARLNRPVLWCGRLGAHLTPALLRRAVGLTVGAGIGVAVLGGVAVAAETDLGWEVTTNQRSDPDDDSYAPARGFDDPAPPAASDEAGPDASTPTPESPQVTRLQPAEPSTAPLDSAPVDPQAAPVDGTVAVQPGDSLWRIAARHLGPGASDADIAAAWPLWYQANLAVVGSDPDLIHPGQVLAPPDVEADAL